MKKLEWNLKEYVWQSPENAKQLLFNGSLFFFSHHETSTFIKFIKSFKFYLVFTSKYSRNYLRPLGSLHGSETIFSKFFTFRFFFMCSLRAIHFKAQSSHLQVFRHFVWLFHSFLLLLTSLFGEKRFPSIRGSVGEFSAVLSLRDFTSKNPENISKTLRFWALSGATTWNNPILLVGAFRIKRRL